MLDIIRAIFKMPKATEETQILGDIEVCEIFKSVKITPQNPNLSTHLKP